LGVDIAGNAPINGGYLVYLFSEPYIAFIARERLWVVPDSIAASPRLMPVN
jgi:hypothetical protein